MPPMRENGIAQIIKILLSKYNSSKLSGNRKFEHKSRPRTDHMTRKAANAINPLQTLLKGISSTLSQFTTRTTKEDYSTVVKSFLPANAKLLTPKYPGDSREIQFADLDGDSYKELIASYRLYDEIKTIILKKQNEHWSKAAEISNLEYDTLSYRGTTDITGVGRKQLLIGLSSGGKASTLFGYSLDNKKINKMFDRCFSRFAVLEQSKDKDAAARAQLAIWNKKDSGAYSIEVLHWNGLQLEPIKKVTPYYSRSVIPYFAQKVKDSPYTASHWYNLADALEKAGANRDALMAVKVGISQDRNSSLTESFLALKNRISEK